MISQCLPCYLLPHDDYDPTAGRGLSRRSIGWIGNASRVTACHSLRVCTYKLPSVRAWVTSKRAPLQALPTPYLQHLYDQPCRSFSSLHDGILPCNSKFTRFLQVMPRTGTRQHHTFPLTGTLNAGEERLLVDRLLHRASRVLKSEGQAIE